MTLDELTAAVRRVLGYRLGPSNDIAQVIREQQSKLELAPTKPWFLLSEKSFTFTESGESRVTVPVDFLDEYEEGCLTLLGADGFEYELKKDGYDTLRVKYMNCPNAQPQYYAATGNYFRLFPTPDATYKVFMLYYKKAAELISGIDTNVWSLNVPELLVGKAGLVIAQALRDPDAIELFKGMIAENMLLLENQNEARKHNNYEMQIGGPH